MLTITASRAVVTQWSLLAKVYATHSDNHIHAIIYYEALVYADPFLKSQVFVKSVWIKQFSPYATPSPLPWSQMPSRCDDSACQTCWALALANAA